jgi:galactonate dehydratase
VERIVQGVAAVREAVGMSMDIAIDYHGRIHRPMAKMLTEALRPYKLSFIEEPVLPDNNEAIVELARLCGTPIATGERMYSRWDYRRLLELNAIDILQPDLSHAGGISECRRIAAMAEAYDVAVAPHCPLGVLAFAACIQLDAATPNAVFQEQSIGVHDASAQNPAFAWLKDPSVFRYADGFVLPPTGPGLGVEIDEEKVIEAAKNPHNWHNPLWVAFDGTPIEW